MHGLKGIRVVDASTGVAGPYCSKLFADAGADVIKLEPAGGDPLRRWTTSSADLGDEDGGLFLYLNASKRSVVGTLDDRPTAEIETLLAGADLLIEDRPPGSLDRSALCERHPGLVLLSITPFGLTGPLSERPATDFILQAEAGSLAGRSRPGHEPYQAGGDVSAWAGGAFAAVAALAAVRHARETGNGEHVDLSLHAVTAMVTNAYLDLMWGLLGRPPFAGLLPAFETPSVEPTRDGFVGFTTYSAQQMSDFLLLIERPELRETGEFDLVAQRLARLEEWEQIVHAWTRTHDTDEVISLAQMLRIPVAPVCNGQTVLEQEQLRARGVFVEDPSKGFLRPRPPYRLDGRPPAPPRAAPPRGAPHPPHHPPSTRTASSRASGRRPTGPRRGSSPSRACASSTTPPGGPDRSPRRCSRCSAPTSSTSSRSSASMVRARSGARCRSRPTTGGSTASSTSPPTRTSAA